jgi:hypothetical protein
MPNVTRISRSFQNVPAPTIGASDIAIEWFSTGDLSPEEVIIDNMSFYKFSNLDAQELQCEITLPNNYVNGSAINLINGMFFTEEVLGNVLFSADVALIRPSVSVEGVYPDTYSSTNSVIGVDPVSKKFTNINSIDLSLAGVINIPAQAQDRLRVKLYRNIPQEISSANPCLGDVYLLKKSFVAKVS